MNRTRQRLARAEARVKALETERAVAVWERDSARKREVLLAIQAGSLRRRVDVLGEQLAAMERRADNMAAAWQCELRRADRLAAELAPVERPTLVLVEPQPRDEHGRFAKAAGA